MIKFCPNIHFMYLEHAFLDRFQAAAEDGFAAVEMTFAYDVPIEAIAGAATSAGVQVIGLNTPSGELVPGRQRGIAAIAGLEDEYLDQIRLGMDYALALGCPRVLTLASIVPDEAEVSGMMDVYVANLARAAALCAEAELTLLIEAHNIVEHPGYLLTTLGQVRELINRVGAPNLKCLYDFYHTQINEGDVTRRFRENLDLIDHVQIGDNPGRHEPGTGELNYPYIFSIIEKSGYDGWVAGEYFPTSDKTSNCHGWMVTCGVKP